MPSALIIEDDPDTAHLLGLLLGRNGWQHERAGTLAEGVARAEKHPFPEIILLDLELPDSTATQTVARIRSLMRNGPVLVLSNYDDPELLERIRNIGAYFAKKETDGPGAQKVFDAMVQAIRAWRDAAHIAKKKTDVIDINLLEMRAILSRNVPAQ